eukprot:6996449-Prymnesium_polylepis.2
MSARRLTNRGPLDAIAPPAAPAACGTRRVFMSCGGGRGRHRERDRRAVRGQRRCRTCRTPIFLSEASVPSKRA